eukprot:290270-Pleurochrysis_carterae.AAC.2
MHRLVNCQKYDGSKRGTKSSDHMHRICQSVSVRLCCFTLITSQQYPKGADSPMNSFFADIYGSAYANGMDNIQQLSGIRCD